MDNFITSVNVVIPLFITMALGYLIARLKLIDDRSITKINNVNFSIFIPILIFMNIYKTDLEEAFDLKLLIFAVVSVVALFFISLLIIPFIEKNNERKAVLMQSVFRSNFVIFGIPITAAICSEENIGATAVLIAVIAPLFNAFAVIVLSIYSKEKVNVKGIIISICKNPLIISSIIGLAFLLLKVNLPSSIDKTILDISKIATPLSLIILGATFKFSQVGERVKSLTNAVLIKLLFVPIILLPISILLGFKNENLIALMVLFASPTSVSSFTMSKKMGSDDILAGQVVVFTSAFSIITVFLWIYLFKTMNLI